MRAAYDQPPASLTPIYDALCAEYRRLFRALPGDRTGEEELRFVGFGTISGTGAAHWRDAGRPRRPTGGAPRPPAAAPAALPPGGTGLTQSL